MNNQQSIGIAVFLASLGLLATAAGCRDASGDGPPQTGAAVALADCPVTVPLAKYVARDPYPPEPPAYYQAVWHGDDALWTMLSPSGETWSGLSVNGGTLTQKTFWWSRDFDARREPQPEISVSGTRLDAPGSFSAGNPGTHALADFGQAMLVGVDIPSAGCWEIRAEYKGAELSLVVLVE